MPRKLVETSDFYPYHIFARSNNKDWFALNLDTVFSIYCEVLNKTIKNYNFEVHSFVLMSNHFHMMMSTPDANVSEGMRYFMTETSRKIARESKRINRIYGARYGSCIIKSSEHYYYAYKYVYRNPVEAKLCMKVENYKWSTIHSRQINLSKNKNGFDEYIAVDKDTYLYWLNEKFEESLSRGVKRALSKKEFKFTKDQKTGKLPIKSGFSLSESAALHP